MNGLTRNRSTPEARAFWDSVDQASEQAKHLPRWMQDKMTKIKTTTIKYSMSTQDLMALIVEALDIPINTPGEIRMHFSGSRIIEIDDDGAVSMYHDSRRQDEIDTSKQIVSIETVEHESDE